VGKLVNIPSAKFLRTAFTFALSFGLGKGVAFSAAIALPRLVDAQTYGGIELALTLGLMGATVLGLGTSSVALRTELVDKDPRAELMLFGLCLWLAGVAVVAAPVALMFHWPVEYALGIALIALFGLQFSGSAYARMKGYIHLSGWLDNSSIMVVVALVGVLTLLGMATVGLLTWWVVAVAVALAALALRRVSGMPWPQFKEIVHPVVRLGAPMMLFGLSQILLFGTARLAIAKELGLTDVACFSLCARIALVLVFASQILSVGLFRSVYRMNLERIGWIFTRWVAVLSGLGFVVTLVSHFTGHLLVAWTEIPAAAFVRIFPLVTIQTTLWILNSNLEMFVVRDLLSRQATIACLSIVGIGAIVGLGLFRWIPATLPAVIWLYSIAMLAMLLVQMRLLARKGVSFRSAYFVLPLVASPWLIELLPAIS
jgi:O-antigen/teichoic acid export membrane protein